MVDRRAAAVVVHLDGVEPVGVGVEVGGGRLVVGVAAEDENVGQRLRAGHRVVRPGGKPHDLDELAERGHVTTRLIGDRVEREVSADQHRDRPALQQPQRLDQEVVVQGVPRGVVLRVVLHVVGERNVADGQRERGVFEPDLGEAAGEDRRGRM